MQAESPDTQDLGHVLGSTEPVLVTYLVHPMDAPAE